MGLVSIFEYLKRNYKLNFSIGSFDENTYVRKLPNLIYDDQIALEYENNGIHVNPIQLDENWHEFLQIYNMNFISYIFIQYFESRCDTLIKYVSKNKKIHINITFDSQNTTVNNYIHHIKNIIYMFVDDDKERYFNFILSPFVKSFTYKSLEKYKYPWLKWTVHMKDDQIRPYNINTGVSIDHTSIFIYRTDEIYKVLIHECIHGSKYNPSEQNIDRVIYVGSNTDILINEAYVEYLAILIWDYYLCMIYDDKSHDINRYELFCHMINRELCNSHLLVGKLCRYYNIVDLNILRRPNDIEESTNAFSYIFVKYLFLKNLLDINNVDDINRILNMKFDKLKFDLLDEQLNLSYYKL